MYLYDARQGETLAEAVKKMVSMAAKTNTVVMAEFNQIILVVAPGDDEKKIIDFYFSERLRIANSFAENVRDPYA